MVEYSIKTHIKTTRGWLSKTDPSDWQEIYQEYLDGKSPRELSVELSIRLGRVKEYFVKFSLPLLGKDELRERAIKKREASNELKYGVKYPMQSTIIKNNTKQTNLKRYGVEHTLQAKEVRDKIEDYWMKECGAKTNLQTKETKDKTRQTKKVKYGDENYNNREKAKTTCKEKYGVEYPNQCKKIRNKTVKTNLEKYGVEHSFQAEEVKDKIKYDCLKKHGCENHSQRKEIKDKSKRSAWYNTEVKIKKFLKNNKYELVDTFKGVHTNDDLGNYIEWKKYKVKHLECGTVYETAFYADVFSKCPTCYPYQSVGELKVRSYVSELLSGVNLITNTRNVIFKELDIYMKELKTAFEYNGDYWHSTVQDSKCKNYHKNKTEACLNKDVKLYHIWEHDNTSIIKSLIRTKLNKVERKLFARKLQLKEVKTKDRIKFFNTNHLHGDVNSYFVLGLYSNEELVQCISFRKHKEGIEIARFATLLNTSVVGGFSRLLKHSIEKIKESGYNKIITYCDRDWTPDYKDSVYYKNGFNFVCDSGVQLKYVDVSNGSIHSREKYQKHKLQALFPDVYSNNLTADEILAKKHIFPIYNSGNWKFELSI